MIAGEHPADFERSLLTGELRQCSGHALLVRPGGDSLSPFFRTGVGYAWACWTRVTTEVTTSGSCWRG
jgi:hypothetical protein